MSKKATKAGNKSSEKSGSVYPNYKQLRYFVQQYGRIDVPDHRAIWDYVELETDEMVRTFRSELRAVSKKNYDEEVMHNILGKRRMVKHGSYDEWARQLLLVMASRKRI